jgi:hypothetical protein
MRLRMEKGVIVASPITHLKSYQDLITPHEQTRAGFIALALEKNRKATPFIEEAKALKAITSKVKNPLELLDLKSIRPSILTASGISDKAKKHLTAEDEKVAILGLIKNYLEPAGSSFVDELVYRFLLTRGDSLGGSMRNIGGIIGHWKLIRVFMSTLTIHGKDYYYLDSKTRKWNKPTAEPDLEKKIKGFTWKTKKKDRTLIYNLNVPIIKNNVDMCIFDSTYNGLILNNDKSSAHYKAEKYLALGELKCGIDPAGADEHWKTANSALNRIRSGFKLKGYEPFTFFIGAAIEKAMAEEIYKQLQNKTMNNAANLTNQVQLVSLFSWLIEQ